MRQTLTFSEAGPRQSRRGSFARCIFRGLAVLVCLATVLPLLRTDKWWVRVLDFPRIQVAALGVGLIVAGLLARRRGGKGDWLLGWGVAVAVAGQLVQILPYTPLGRRQVADATGAGMEVRLLAFNVLQSNRNVQALLEFVAQRQPDLILLTEIDPWWLEQTSVLRRHYPHVVARPLTNTYGIALYSRLQLVNPGVRFLVQEDVPSIRAQVKLSDGRLMHFYGVHPKPPGVKTPRGAIPDSAPRDAELIVIAKEVERVAEPVIVAGDFNDVAWSHTTRLFQRTGRLLDPRRGRGLFNTFHAKQPLFRFPVDHVFHSEHFALLNLERLPGIGSDHFPVFAALRLSPEAPERQEPPAPKTGDGREAERTLRKAREE